MTFPAVGSRIQVGPSPTVYSWQMDLLVSKKMALIGNYLMSLLPFIKVPAILSLLN